MPMASSDGKLLATQGLRIFFHFEPGNGQSRPFAKAQRKRLITSRLRDSGERIHDLNARNPLEPCCFQKRRLIELHLFCARERRLDGP